jgi:hypothetical protein
MSKKYSPADISGSRGSAVLIAFLWYDRALSVTRRTRTDVVPLLSMPAQERKL